MWSSYSYEEADVVSENIKARFPPFPYKPLSDISLTKIQNHYALVSHSNPHPENSGLKTIYYRHWWPDPSLLSHGWMLMESAGYGNWFQFFCSVDRIIPTKEISYTSSQNKLWIAVEENTNVNPRKISFFTFSLAIFGKRSGGQPKYHLFGELSVNL